MKLKISLDGKVAGVYDERLTPLAKRLGRMTATRASEVEFDDATQQWVARSLKTGEILAYDPSRQAVVEKEKAAIEKDLHTYV